MVLNTLKLGQLREREKQVDNERMEIRWYREGRNRSEFDDKFEINAEGGVWSVIVRFITAEVRSDPNGLLEDSQNFTITFQANSTTIQNMSLI